MPLRDIALTLFVFGMLPMCFTRPWIGILMWSWIGYMNPHKLTWSFAFYMPFAQLVAIATIGGFVLARDPERRPMPWYRETGLMLGLWIVYAFTTVLSVYPDMAWPQFLKVSKILFFTFATLFYFQSRERLRWLFLVLALSLGFYGLKGGIWAITSGGNSSVMGPENTFIGGNTEIGLALNMTLPFLLILAREEKRRWLRRLLLAMFVFSVVAVLFTYSRGAVIGLPVVLMMLFMRARRRLIGLVAFLLLAWFISAYAPEKWVSRMQTIETYEQDRSAQSRLQSWYVAWRYALDHPLTGGGFWVLDHDETFSKYLSYYIRAQSAHSIYFTVLGDHGFPGLGLFLGLIGSMMLSLRSLRRKLRDRPDAAWMVNYCQMLEASLAAYAVSGAFLSQAYWDLFYHLASFVILLRAIADRMGLVPMARDSRTDSMAVLPMRAS